MPLSSVEVTSVERVTDAGERTRTSKGFRPTGPKPVASASSATPARFKDSDEREDSNMTDPEDRLEESRETDETRYDRETEEEARERDAAAERLKREKLPEPDEE
jgi:hypothetical protein